MCIRDRSISLGAVLGISNVIEELEGGIVIYCYPCDQESALNESGFEKIHGGFLLKVGKRTCESSGNIPGFINNSTLNRLFCHNLKEDVYKRQGTNMSYPIDSLVADGVSGTGLYILHR